MEFISTIKNKWKFFLIVSSFWCLFLVLSLNQNLNLTDNTQNTVQEFANSTTNPNEKLQKLTQIHNTHVENLNISFNKLGKLINKSIDDQKKCNMFVGKWVYNPEEIVQYDYVSCPFIEEKMSCQKNGRPDSDYQKWRWEAKDCDIPLFDGRYMLERLRNKRLIIAGDSMNRNMWESLACLLYSSIPSSRVEVDAKNLEYKVLKAKDYNAIVEFYWSPYLMEFDANHTSGKKVLIIDQVSNNSKQWKGADVMIFNSALWWPLRGQFKKWDLLQYKGQLLEDLPIDKAYEVGMKTWAKWIKQNVDPNTTKVFFRSLSALHSGKPYCYKATRPLKDGSSNKNNFPKSMINIIENIIKGMTNPQVKYLNITKLSEYRIDAHPSIYKSSQWNKLHMEKSLIHTYSDCNHWCLPGLPDTWNRLLYASLFFDMGI